MTSTLVLAIVLVAILIGLAVWAVCARLNRKPIPFSSAALRYACLETLERHGRKVGALCPNNKRLIEFALALGGATDGPTRDPDGHFDTCKACEGLVRQLARAVREKRKGASRTKPSAA